ncbi:hypothetical protein MYX84_04850 [Acidobacteria bacterium AH-259-O06]|nr:hypothetical protein [Acidobacteria bacterium AH-259-O06]
MRRILVISSNEVLLRDLRWRLEDAGYIVSFSPSLEETFLEAGQTEPFMVIVDAEAIPDELGQAQKILRWFHRRSPVLLLSNNRCTRLERECDRCLPRAVEKEKLLSCIRELLSQ